MTDRIDPDFVLVPREPTEEMTLKGFIELAECDNNERGETGAQIVTRIYKAMLAAAPKPTSPHWDAWPHGDRSVD